MRQRKSVIRFLQFCLMAVLFLTIMIPAGKQSMISGIGIEDVYWERARYFLGQGGASPFRDSSVYSLGYSVMLMPICAIVKSPYAAYKAALLLNGFILCATYVMSINTSKKLFPKESELFLSVACFFVMICPMLAIARTHTGPELPALFLLWTAVYLLADLRERYNWSKLAGITVCLLLMVFLQVTLIGVACVFVLILWIFVEKQKLKEMAYLEFLLALLLGVIAENAAERVFLSSFAKSLDLTYKSSLEVLFDGISAGWKAGYLGGLGGALAGKLFAGMIGTFLFLCPGLWAFLRQSRRQLKKRSMTDKDTVFNGIFLALLIQITVMALYDNSRMSADGLTSLSGLEGVLTLVLLVGIVYVKNTVKWQTELAGYLMAVCACAFWTASIWQKEGVDDLPFTSGSVLLAFTGGELMPVSAVYIASGFLILAGIILILLLKSTTRRKALAVGLRMLGFAVLCGLSGWFDAALLKQTAAAPAEEYMRQIAPLASLLSESSAWNSCYYLSDGGRDEEIALLQSLLPDRAIDVVQNREKDRYAFFQEHESEPEQVLLTGTGEHFLEVTLAEDLEDYRLLFMTNYFALWTHKDSQTKQELDARLAARVMEPELAGTELETGEEMADRDGASEVEKQALEEATSEAEAIEAYAAAEERLEEERQTETATESEKKAEITAQSEKRQYGNGFLLAPGTYRLMITLHCSSASQGMQGRVVMTDAEGDRLTHTFGDELFDSDGNGTIRLDFSSREVMRECKIVISGTATLSTEITSVYYQKLTSAYRIGLEALDETESLCKMIRNLDQSSGTAGTVCVVDRMAADSRDIAAEDFEERLPGYEVTASTGGDPAGRDAVYLVGRMDSHFYYPLMEDYSIIFKGESFVVLVKNGTAQYAASREIGRVRSAGTMLSMRLFGAKQDDAVRKVSLDAGSYVFHVRVSGVQENGDAAEPGTAPDDVRIMLGSGNKTLAEHVLTPGEIQRALAGEAEFALPVSLQAAKKQIACVIKSDTNKDVSWKVKAMQIELASEDYQYGQEEEALPQLTKLVKESGADTLYVVRSRTALQSEWQGLDYLQELLPSLKIRFMNYEQAILPSEDRILITRGFNGSYIKLLSKYTVIGQAGQYTLMADAHGEYLQNAVKAGASVLSNGTGFPPDMVARIRGKEPQEDRIEYLPRGQYDITLELEASGLEEDDTIELSMMRDKTDEELETEREELRDAGYSEEEIENKINLKIVCGSAEYQTYQFKNLDRLMVTVTVDSDTRIDNLAMKLYSWHGAEVKGKLLWVEKQ